MDNPSIDKGDNKKEFDNKIDAAVFAAHRVVEGWITHWYPEGKVFIVHWWCQ